MIPIIRPFTRPVYLDPSVKAFYVFDTGVGVEDISGNDNHGSLAGATSFKSTGRYGSAVNFTGGAGDHIECGNDASINFTDVITVEAWYRWASSPPDQGIIVGKHRAGNDGSWTVLYPSAGNIRFTTVTTGDNRVDTSYAFAKDTNWHYVVATYDGAFNRIYVDGALGDSDAQTGALLDSSAGGLNETMRIGAISTNGNWPFKGDIDMVRVSNTVLSANEIAQNYLSGI